MTPAVELRVGLSPFNPMTRLPDDCDHEPNGCRKLLLVTDPFLACPVIANADVSDVPLPIKPARVMGANGGRAKFVVNEMEIVFSSQGYGVDCEADPEINAAHWTVIACKLEFRGASMVQNGITIPHPPPIDADTATLEDDCDAKGFVIVA